MWREVTTLWQSVLDPEYAHLLLEALPLYGLGIGLTFLIVAFVVGEKICRLLALAVIALSCASVWPYLELRDEATVRILAVHPPADAPAIRAQTRLRHDTAWAYYAMALLAAATLAGARTPKLRLLIPVTVFAGMVLFWLSIWLHKKEAEVYHRNTIRQIQRR